MNQSLYKAIKKMTIFFIALASSMQLAATTLTPTASSFTIPFNALSPQYALAPAPNLTICIDVNNNRTCDPTEAQTTSAYNNRFDLNAIGATRGSKILAYRGADFYYGKLFNGQYTRYYAVDRNANQMLDEQDTIIKPNIYGQLVYWDTADFNEPVHNIFAIRGSSTNNPNHIGLWACVDKNKNQLCDADEYKARVDKTGTYQLLVPDTDNSSPILFTPVVEATHTLYARAFADGLSAQPVSLNPAHASLTGNYVYRITQQPAKGTATALLAVNGLFTYTPDANANGADTILYSMTNAQTNEIHQGKLSIKHSPYYASLPPKTYALTNQALKIMFDNVLLDSVPHNGIAPHPYRTEFYVDGVQTGTLDATSWTKTFTAQETGVKKLTLKVISTNNNALLDEANSMLIVRASSPHATSLKPSKVMMIGDSNTAYGGTTERMHNNFINRGINTIKFVGSVTSSGAYNFPGFAIEAYGSTTWYSWASKDWVSTTDLSPFVFPGDVLDMARYFTTNPTVPKPDVVTIQLGTNDAYAFYQAYLPTGATPTNAQFNAWYPIQLKGIGHNQDKLIAEIKRVLPNATIVISVLMPGNMSSNAFTLAGQFSAVPVSRWDFKRAQHLIASKTYERFAGQEHNKIFVVNASLGVDPVNHFTDTAFGAVHPNAQGYFQIGDGLTVFLNHLLNR